jgi:hypothetical protein
MALANVVQGATHTPQRITWSDSDGTAVNLTGATITASRRNIATGTTTAVTGTLALVTAESGIFDWTYSAADVATAGEYYVQFTATYGDSSIERTLQTAWVVEPAL